MSQRVFVRHSVEIRTMESREVLPSGSATNKNGLSGAATSGPMARPCYGKVASRDGAQHAPGVPAFALGMVLFHDALGTFRARVMPRVGWRRCWAVVTFAGQSREAVVGRGWLARGPHVARVWGRWRQGRHRPKSRRAIPWPVPTSRHTGDPSVTVDGFHITDSWQQSNGSSPGCLATRPSCYDLWRSDNDKERTETSGGTERPRGRQGPVHTLSFEQEAGIVRNGEQPFDGVPGRVECPCEVGSGRSGAQAVSRFPPKRRGRQRRATKAALMRKAERHSGTQCA